MSISALDRPLRRDEAARYIRDYLQLALPAIIVAHDGVHRHRPCVPTRWSIPPLFEGGFRLVDFGENQPEGQKHKRADRASRRLACVYRCPRRGLTPMSNAPAAKNSPADEGCSRGAESDYRNGKPTIAAPCAQ